MSAGVLAEPQVQAGVSAGALPARAESGGHMVQLDAVRAIAALMVLVGHFSTHARWLAPTHHMGVRLFFVLSGFLITGILLRCRDLAELEGQGTWPVMKRFYARRFLRIFPLFYLTLLAAVALNLEHARANAGWLLSYTSNLRMALTGQSMGNLGPYWSLAVEEQFYLVWPWVIMLAPRRWLVPAIIATVLVGPLYRSSAVLAQVWQMSQGLRQSFNLSAVRMPPLACLDTLGMGALLAWTSQKSVDPRWRRRLMAIALWVGLPFMLLMHGLHKFAFSDTVEVRECFRDTAWALFFTWLVGCAARGFDGAVGALLRWRTLAYIGTISYGIYVYHSFLWYIPHEKLNAWLAPHLAGWFAGGAEGALAFLNRHFAQSGYGLFLPRIALAMAVAALSWKLFEKPLNDLKRHFEYDQRRRPQPAVAEQPAAMAEAAG